MINGDGCDSLCKVEKGWRCIQGHSDAGDKCIELCGDGIRINTTSTTLCDDSNRVSGDGCSKLCDIERGWVCSGGSPTSKDTCYEICGDGIHGGGVECDDGNTANGDGCSSTCTIETGYECSGGSLYTVDVC